MNLFLYQLKQAVVSLKQKPGFVVSVVSTMGITLGALLCVLTLAYVMLLKPLPYPEQERLFVVESKIKGNERAPKTSLFPYPAFVELYQKQSTLSNLAMVAFEETNITSLSQQPRVKNTFVSPEYFELLAPPMALGRSFNESEALNSHHPVVVISYDTWLTLFGRQPDVLEQNLTINDISYRIIGVTDKGFIEPSLYQTGVKTQLWLPWDFNFVPERARKAWGNFAPNLFLLGKLAKNQTIIQAQSTLTPQLSERWQQELVGNARFKEMSLAAELKPLIKVISGNDNSSLALLFFAIIGLLVIAITNVSHLFVARNAEQQQQIAIKTSLGMSYQQGLMQVFTEISCLMAFAFVIALVSANVGFFVIQTYLAELFNRVDELRITFLPFAGLVTVILLISFALTKLSYKKLTIEQLNASLQNSNKGQGTSVSKLFQQGIMTNQILVTILIIFANMVLFKQAYQSINQETGFVTDDIQQLVLSYNAAGRPKSTEQRALYQQVKAQLLTMPVVKSVSLGNSPLSSYSVRPFSLAGVDTKQSIEQKDIDTDYFTMFKQPLIAGDFFTENEVLDGTNVIIVNQRLANYLAQFGDVIGQEIKNSRDESLRIKGIVANTQLPVTESRSDNDFLIYRPTTLTRGTSILMQLVAGQNLSREQLVELVTTIDSRYSIYQYHSLEQRYQESLLNKKVTLATTGMLTLIVLLLAALGLFGILDFNSRTRRFEIGTHMAIGAKSKDIITLVFKENAGALIVGIVASLFILLGLYLSFNEHLASYISLDLLPIYISTLALLSSLSFFACYLPLRQYVNKPAIHSLRGER